jgi:hypothetical protein
MQRSISDHIAGLIRTEGREVLLEPRRFERLLRNTFPEGRREIAALLAALRVGIPRRLSKRIWPVRVARFSPAEIVGSARAG